ncbi:MAG: dTDP-4-dehydrorhamnose 3,5-epimerase [Magnetococcales bacterium]|nr:dTDP-4-dehydrorhamnose 3,5-epimerase [Magnetococcales bacterium]
MRAEPLKLEGVYLITPKRFDDPRGSFFEVWNRKTLHTSGINVGMVVQENQSHSKAGVLRGLHYQIQYPQGKLVRVLSGAILDVAVDLRRSSPTFSQWLSHTLTADSREQLWIPAGFAHGFRVLGDSAEILYSCTDYYCPEQDRTLLWNDPDIAIDWQLTEGEEVLLSDKDQAGHLLRDAETYP